MTAAQALTAAQGPNGVTRCAWCRGGIEVDEPRQLVRETFIVCGTSCAKFLEARLVRSGAQPHQHHHQQQPTSRPDPLALAIQQRLADLAKPAAPAAAPSGRFTAWSVWRVLAAGCGKDGLTPPPAGRRLRSREEDC